MAAKRKAKRKKARSAAQKAATKRMIAGAKKKRSGRKPAASKPTRRRRRRKAAAVAAAPAKRTRRRRARKGGSAKRRAWNKGKKFSKTRKQIKAYSRKPTVRSAKRWVNPRRRRYSRRRRRNPEGIMGLAVAFAGGGAALIATQHAEPMIPLTGYGLAAAEVVAGLGLGWLASKLHPMLGAGVAVGIGGSGVKHAVDELMGPPAAKTASSLAGVMGAGSWRDRHAFGAIDMAAIGMSRSAQGMAAIDLASVENSVDAIDLQMGAIDDGLGCCEDSCGYPGEEENDFITTDYEEDVA